MSKFLNVRDEHNELIDVNIYDNVLNDIIEEYDGKLKLSICDGGRVIDRISEFKYHYPVIVAQGWVCPICQTVEGLQETIDEVEAKNDKLEDEVIDLYATIKEHIKDYQEISSDVSELQSTLTEAEEKLQEAYIRFPEFGI